MLAAVLHREFFDERARFLSGAGQLLERRDIDFDVEVAGIADHRAVLHLFEMLVRDARTCCR